MVHLKSHREIEHLRESADLVSRTLAEVAKVIGPGVTTNQLDAVAEAFILDNGARPAFKGYGSEPNVFPATLCTSVNDVVVHGIPDDELLQNGDVVSVDETLFTRTRMVMKEMLDIRLAYDISDSFD